MQRADFSETSSHPLLLIYLVTFHHVFGLTSTIVKQICLGKLLLMVYVSQYMYSES